MNWKIIKMKKLVWTFILTTLIGIEVSLAETLTLTTYYPAPVGAYDRIKLFPRSPLLPGDCSVSTEGTFYHSSSSRQLEFCTHQGGSYTWQPFGGLWSKRDWSAPDADIYLPNTNWFVGIGTDPNTDGQLVSSLTVKGSTSDNSASGIEVLNSNSDSLFYIQNDGKIGIGTKTLNKKIEILNDNDIDFQIEAVSNNALDNAGINFNRARGTPASRQAVQNGDIIGNLKFHGYDGTKFIELARITSEVDGDPGPGDMPGLLKFYTTPDNSNTPIERMKITNAGNIGMGDSFPNAVLEVSTSGLAIDPLMLSSDDGNDGDLFIIKDTATPFNVGNVGIGTNTPAESFHIKGDGDMLLEGTDGSTRLYMRGVGNEEYFMWNDGTAFGISRWISATSTAENKFTLHKNGNVAIGVDQTPEARLEIIQSGAVPSFMLSSDNASDGDRLISDANGNLGIGTTAPGYKLDVAGDMYVRSGNCYRYNGTIQFGGCTSDERLKRHLKPFNHSLKKISQLKPINFQFFDEQYGHGDQLGLSAQNVETVFPEWVIKGADGYKKIEYGLDIQMHLIQAVKELRSEFEANAAALRAERNRFDEQLRALEKP